MIHERGLVKWGSLGLGELLVIPGHNAYDGCDCRFLFRAVARSRKAIAVKWVPLVPLGGPP